MIKNISPEEFEQLSKKKIEIQDTVEVFKDEIKKPSKVNFLEGVKLKEKTSIFEPEPVKYPLITQNNIVKNNLTENCEIFVRRMSGEEDIYLQNIFYTDDVYKITENMTKIIEGCIKSDIDVKSLPIIEKIPLFLFILSISLESGFDAAPIPGCSTCDENTKVILDISDFPLKRMKKSDPEFPKKIKLTTYDNSEIYMLITLPKIGSENLFIKLSKDKKEYIEKLLQLIEDIYGKKQDGTDVRKDEWVSILNFLNLKDKETIKNIQEDIDNNYGINTKIVIKNCSNSNCCMVKSGEEVEFDLFDLMRKFLVNMVATEQVTLNNLVDEKH